MRTFITRTLKAAGAMRFSNAGRNRARRAYQAAASSAMAMFLQSIGFKKGTDDAGSEVWENPRANHAMVWTEGDAWTVHFWGSGSSRDGEGRGVESLKAHLSMHGVVGTSNRGRRSRRAYSASVTETDVFAVRRGIEETQQKLVMLMANVYPATHVVPRLKLVKTILTDAYHRLTEVAADL